MHGPHSTQAIENLLQFMHKHLQQAIRLHLMPWLAGIFLMSAASGAGAAMTCAFKPGSAFQAVTVSLPVQQ